MIETQCCFRDRKESLLQRSSRHFDLRGAQCTFGYMRTAAIKVTTKFEAKVDFFYSWMKVFRDRDLLGCCNFLKAFASICLILSRVTENCFPTSSKV